MLNYWNKKIRNVIIEEGILGFFKKAFKIIKNDIFSKQPKEFIIIYKVLRGYIQNGVMIDVGAAHGDALRLFANRGWNIYAFEPDPKNRSVINQLLGNYLNVVVDPRAVSSETKSNVQFFTSNISFGLGSLEPFHHSHKPSVQVDVVTLKSYIGEMKIKKVDFLKIDAEGFDFFVLKGFPWNVTQLYPGIILCEFEDSKTKNLGYSWKDMADFLQNKGYRVIVSEWFPIDDYSHRHRWKRLAQFPCELQDENAWGNIIATKNDLINKKIIDGFSSFTR